MKLSDLLIYTGEVPLKIIIWSIYIGVVIAVIASFVTKSNFGKFVSALIEKAAVQGGGGVTFVIGGADGLDEKSKQLCDFRLSFSKMTFPHQLMRVILTEQLYRALNISAGGHYHH